MVFVQAQDIFQSVREGSLFLLFILSTSRTEWNQALDFVVVCITYVF